MTLRWRCRYLVQNLDWLQDLLTEYSDDDYFIFDCPGASTLST